MWKSKDKIILFSISVRCHSKEVGGWGAQSELDHRRSVALTTGVTPEGDRQRRRTTSVLPQFLRFKEGIQVFLSHGSRCLLYKRYDRLYPFVALIILIYFCVLTPFCLVAILDRSLRRVEVSLTKWRKTCLMKCRFVPYALEYLFFCLCNRRTRGTVFAILAIQFVLPLATSYERKLKRTLTVPYDGAYSQKAFFIVAAELLHRDVSLKKMATDVIFLRTTSAFRKQRGNIFILMPYEIFFFTTSSIKRENLSDKTGFLQVPGFLLDSVTRVCDCRSSNLEEGRKDVLRCLTAIINL